MSLTQTHLYPSNLTVYSRVLKKIFVALISPSLSLSLESFLNLVQFCNIFGFCNFQMSDIYTKEVKPYLHTTFLQHITNKHQQQTSPTNITNKHHQQTSPTNTTNKQPHTTTHFTHYYSIQFLF
jgi:hypothetical protein